MALFTPTWKFPTLSIRSQSGLTSWQDCALHGILACYQVQERLLKFESPIGRPRFKPAAFSPPRPIICFAAGINCPPSRTLGGRSLSFAMILICRAFEWYLQFVNGWFGSMFQSDQGVTNDRYTLIPRTALINRNGNPKARIKARRAISTGGM